jgi:hypothetical protein
MNYNYELKYSGGLKKEKIFFVYESENGIRVGMSSIKDIISQPNNTLDSYGETRKRMYYWLLMNHSELLI